MRRFYYHSLPEVGNNICLDTQNSHHLLRVVGISKNEEVEIFDGNGRACIAILRDIQKKAILEIIKSVEIQQSADVEYWLLVALVRPEPFSNILRMATEIGVHHIIPFQCNRSLQRSEKTERWERIIFSAVQQCGRYDIPKLYPMQTFAEALDIISHVDQKWIFHPMEASATVSEQWNDLENQTIRHRAVVVGPEGGFEDEEIQLACEKKCMHKVLGRLIFRTDTAVAVTLAHMKFGRM